MHALRHPAAVLIACAVLGHGLDAQAQTFSGLGAAPTLVLPRPPEAPGPPTHAAPQADPATALPAVTPQDPAADPGPGLHRLPPIAAPLRLWGENGSLTFVLTVTEAQARAGGRFQIGFLAAVSVLPDASRLTVSLNGAALGSTAIDAARGARTVAFDLPAGLLAAGANRVDVSVTQRHRVDCSVAATYELWTQIDPQATGLLSTGAGPAVPADIAAIPGGPDGAVPIRLLQTGERLSERGVERVLGALQDTVLAGRYAQPTVDFGPGPGEGEGLALAVGRAAELGGSLDLAALGPVAGPRLALLPGTGGRRPVLVATGADEADVAAALGELGRLRRAPPIGHPAGLRALAEAGGRPVTGAQTISLADLGLPDAHVAARTHRIAFDLALPHDVVPADYDRLVLDLDMSYPAGLAEGAQVVVEIDGRNAGNASLGRPGGEAMARRSVFLPLALLRPGLNRVSIRAELPRADDATCASEAGVPTERLHLAATSRLTIPPLARIGRQPEIAATVAAAFPYAGAARRPTLLVPAPDRDTMAAAATLVARLGLAAGRPIPFAFAAGRTGIVGPTLVVSPARGLDGTVLAAAGLDPQALRDAWSARDPAERPREGASAIRRRVLSGDGIAACAGIAGAPRPQEDAPRGLALADASALLAQGVTGPAQDDLLTLVTAPGAATLREAVACLVHPRVWARPQGRLATLSGADGSVSFEAATDPRYVVTAPLSPGNLRRIAAGWLSLHAGLYGLFGLVIAGGLAGSTRALVRNLGRRSA